LEVLGSVGKILSK